MGFVGRQRFRVSVRSLMVAVALVALALVPFLLVARQTAMLRAQAMRAVEAELRAREEAERARYAAQVLVPAKADPLSPGVAGPGAAGRGGLWAALAVNHAALHVSDANDLSVELTLVNDGPAAVDPRVGESRLTVNGEELAVAGRIPGNGPKDARFAPIPPGGILRFGHALCDSLRRPGVYRVSWRGPGFQSPEVVVRVLPDAMR